MISEGSCDWSNDGKNLPSNLHLQCACIRHAFPRARNLPIKYIIAKYGLERFTLAYCCLMRTLVNGWGKV